jgi:PST family polysaccharide transporter
VSALSFIRKLTGLSGTVTLLFSIGLLLFAPQIVAITLGADYGPSIAVIQILSFLPFVCALGNIFGTQLMINFGLSRDYATIIFTAGLFNVLSAFVLIPFLKENGIAISVMLTEMLITAAMFAVLEIKRLSPRRRHINELAK